MKKKTKPITKYWKETIELFNWFIEHLKSKRDEELRMMEAYKIYYTNWISEELKVLEQFKLDSLA